MGLKHRRFGFSLAELIVVLAIFGLMVPVALQGKTYSEEELAAQEAENLARWFRSAFARSDANGQAFSILMGGSNAINRRIKVHWPEKDDVYSSDQALFKCLGTADYTYRPWFSSANPFGITIRVHQKSGKGDPVRYVIISRFGRVRISKVDVVNYDE